MQTSNRLFDDLAKVANGAVSTLVGVRDEIEALVRQRVDKLLADADLVPREEFEVVKAMVTEARTEQEHLLRRLAALEPGEPPQQAVARRELGPGGWIWPSTWRSTRSRDSLSSPPCTRPNGSRR